MLHNLNERNNLAGNSHGDTTDYQGEPGSLGFNLTAIRKSTLLLRVPTLTLPYPCAVVDVTSVT